MASSQDYTRRFNCTNDSVTAQMQPIWRSWQHILPIHSLLRLLRQMKPLCCRAEFYHEVFGKKFLQQLHNKCSPTSCVNHKAVCPCMPHGREFLSQSCCPSFLRDTDVSQCLQIFISICCTATTHRLKASGFRDGLTVTVTVTVTRGLILHICLFSGMGIFYIRANVKPVCGTHVCTQSMK
jgi:hypothetical protein